MRYRTYVLGRKEPVGHIHTKTNTAISEADAFCKNQEPGEYPVFFFVKNEETGIIVHITKWTKRKR